MAVATAARSSWASRSSGSSSSTTSTYRSRACRSREGCSCCSSPWRCCGATASRPRRPATSPWCPSPRAARRARRHRPGHGARAQPSRRPRPGGGGGRELVTLLVVGGALPTAERLSRVVAPSVVQLLTRVLGLLLSAIAVELIVDGVRGLVRAGPDGRALRQRADRRHSASRGGSMRLTPCSTTSAPSSRSMSRPGREHDVQLPVARKWGCSVDRPTCIRRLVWAFSIGGCGTAWMSWTGASAYGPSATAVPRPLARQVDRVRNAGRSVGREPLRRKLGSRPCRAVARPGPGQRDRRRRDAVPSPRWRERRRGAVGRGRAHPLVAFLRVRG